MANIKSAKKRIGVNRKKNANNVPKKSTMKSAIKKAETGKMKGIIGTTDLPLVSTDFIGEPRTCVVDVTAGIMLNPTFVKLVAWYDNEYGYSCKLVDMLKLVGSN